MARPLTNPLALAVLTLLAEAPMHPYEISTTLKQRRKEDSIKLNFGSLYSVVESLQKRGLVEVHSAHREGNRPERTIYGITEEGNEVMRSWLSEMISTPAKDYPQFVTALSLMPILSPDEVLPLLRQRLECLQATRAGIDQMLQAAREMGLPQLFTIEHDYELAALKVEEDFVDQLLTRLTNGELDGLVGWERSYQLRASGRSQSEIEAILRAEFPDEFSWIDQLGN